MTFPPWLSPRRTSPSWPTEARRLKLDREFCRPNGRERAAGCRPYNTVPIAPRGPFMTPPEIVVLDSPHPCGYLPGRTARLPYRHPIERLAPEQFDARLAEGDRRSGVFLYRTQCPECRACEPIRLDLATFRPSATQRRTQRRGDELLKIQIGPPRIDQARLDLFNAHRDQRGLARGEEPIDGEGYADFLTESCCDTLELTCWHEGRLVACAIADAGRESLSAVYTHFDPGFTLLSLGTYCVLREVELCRQSGRRYLYLGFYIAESPHMVYKAGFHPHQRRIAGQWRDFA
jgi:arginyl-tRNA--protein-N-Asp/Glu arginylyltransferase